MLGMNSNQAPGSMTITANSLDSVCAAVIPAKFPPTITTRERSRAIARLRFLSPPLAIEKRSNCRRASADLDNLYAISAPIGQPRRQRA